MTNAAAAPSDPPRGIRVGYTPFSSDLLLPGDRRRFVHYATRRGIRFEVARESERYDLVVVTQAADLTRWSRLPRSGGRLLFDLTDAYLSESAVNPKVALRGLAKFVTGQTRRLAWDYRELLRDTCRRADAVVCASKEQREAILPFCENVHPVLDFQFAALGSPKSSYRAGDPFTLVWEGLPENVETFREIAEVLRAFRRRQPFLLRLVTAPRYFRYLRRVGPRSTIALVRDVIGADGVELLPWAEDTVAGICTAADLAVLPMPLHDPLSAGKPENKLIYFWRLGVPVVASASASYLRAMRSAGLPLACATPQEWVDALERMFADEESRRSAGLRGRAFADGVHGEEQLLCRWDAAVASALASGGPLRPQR